MNCLLLEWLRPLARSASNAAIFTAHTDPALIEFENSISNNNCMFMMKVIGQDCSDEARYNIWLEEGKEGLEGVPAMLLVGDDDGLFPVEDCREAVEFLGIPETQFHVVCNSGHLPMLDQPEEVSRHIKTFVQQQQSS